MSEDDKTTDRFGDEVPPATSPLLFVTGDEEDEGYEEIEEIRHADPLPPPPSEPSSGNRTTLAIGVLLGILVVSAAGLSLLGGNDSEDPIIVPPTEPPALNQGEVRIAPFPSGDIDGAVRSSIPVGVRVTYGSGGAVSDTVVEYRVESGEGVLETQVVRTSREGIAIARLGLPDRPGTTVVRATLQGSMTTFARVLASALPGAAATFNPLGGAGQEALAGDLLPRRVEVRMVDGDGNPVSNAQVEFSVVIGSGVVAPTRTRTDSTGVASARWRLGLEEGEQVVQVSSRDLASGVLTFSANALPRATGEPAVTRIETRPVSVAARTSAVGTGHICDITGGTVRCRGSATRGQTGGDGETGFVFLAAGSSHTCGLTADGTATCWGANESGQLGDGLRRDRPRPAAVRSDVRFSALALGTAHTCGLAGGGTPLCWGKNLNGQLGDGSRNDTSSPRMVGGGIEFVDIVAGWDHTCALTSNGNVFCWGLNQDGQLGDGTRLDQLQPKLATGGMETLVAGASHTCGISSGQVMCWGSNAMGQLGTGVPEGSVVPAAVTGLPGRPTSLAAGAVHTCALVQGGQAYCWGQNRSGQLGNGTTTASPTPVAVSGGLRFASISAGGAQTCGRTADGADYCWGLNQVGQLGDGTRTSRPEPTRVQR